MASPTRLRFRRRQHRGRTALLLAVVACLLAGQAVQAAAAPGRTRVVQSLPDDLEQIRQAEATSLYGSPEVRPLDERRTAVVSLGDSQLSGEGAGNYEPGTDGPGNWCHRSADAGVHKIGIGTDLSVNLACSGGKSAQLVYRSGASQYGELNQGDNLAIKARNTRVKLVWLATGANDPGGAELGAVARDCATRRVFFSGNCWPSYTDDWQRRVSSTQSQVETAISSIQQTMRDAGYYDSDYQLMVMSYPAALSPDVEDNPRFPGWYEGGCLIYLKDAAFARNKALPMLARGVRQAAKSTGARYLDASRLFHGHEVCSDNPWVRGFTLTGADLTNPHAIAQSFHPNAGGHQAFGSCVAAFHGNPAWTEATCVDPASTGNAALFQGVLEFKQLRNVATDQCADAEGYSTRTGYRMLTWECHGGGNQGFWRNRVTSGLHIELSQDRCVGPAVPDLNPGVAVQVQDCTGAASQRWALVEGLLRSVSNPQICLSPANYQPRAPLTLAACAPDSPLQRWSFEEQTAQGGFGYDDWIPSSAY